MTGETWRRAALSAALGCAVAALAMAPTWRDLARTWSEDAAFLWCWLVVPAVLYGLGRRLGPGDGASLPRFDSRGLWATVPAAVLWWACGLMNLAVGQEFALVMALQGIARSTLGPRLYRESFATLALLFLMVPSADLLQPLLRDITVAGIDLFAAAAGLPHRVEGYEIAIGSQHYIVVEACSGLALVTLSMFLGFFFATLLYRSIRKVLALAAFAALLGVACNLVRVDAIVWIDWRRGSQMDLTAHAEIQWLSMLAVLAVLLLALGRLRGDPGTASCAIVVPSASRRRDRFAPLLVGLSVPLVAWALDGIGLALAPASMGADRVAMQALPAVLEGATRAEGDLRWTVDDGNATASSVATYRRRDAHIHATVVETLSPAAKLPRWQLPAGHWRDLQASRQARCDPRGCVAYNRLILQGAQLDERRTMEAAYCDAGLMTDSLLRLRIAHAWNRVRGLADSRRSVVLVVDGQGLDAGEAANALRTLCGIGH